MIKILFVCHGNICRSPMAEFIMKDLVDKAGRSSEFHIESAAVSQEELGNDMYPPAKRKLREKGIPFERRRARQINGNDVKTYDYIIYMDAWNGRLLRNAYPDGHFVSLLDRDVEDPWYTDDFETAYNDIYAGCEHLLETL